MSEAVSPKHKQQLQAKDLAGISLAAAIIVICSWITVPLTVPVTLQTFAIFTTTGILGLKRGVTAVLVYLLLGAAGLPVFAGFKGGLGELLGVTGGYLLGFIFMAWILGWLVQRYGKKTPILAMGMVLGLAICYLFGTAWFITVYARTTGPLAWFTALSWCVLPFLLPDLIKITLSILIVKRVSKIIS
jgi:biotin transport system substrate-specific component